MPTSNDAYVYSYTGAHVRTYAASVNFARVRSPSIQELSSFSLTRTLSEWRDIDSSLRSGRITELDRTEDRPSTRKKVSSFVRNHRFANGSAERRFANGGRREADRHVVRHVAKGVIRRDATTFVNHSTFYYYARQLTLLKPVRHTNHSVELRIRAILVSNPRFFSFLRLFRCFSRVLLPITIGRSFGEKENQRIDSPRYLSFRSNEIPSDWSGGRQAGGRGEEEEEKNSGR